MRTAMTRSVSVGALLMMACALLGTASAIAQSTPQPAGSKQDWIELFNGRGPH